MSWSLNTVYSHKSDAAFALNIETTIPLSDGVIAIYGESGCGKSTLLKCFSGLLNYQGSFSQNGEIVSQSVGENPCVYQPQSGCLFPALSVKDNLTLLIKHSTWRDTTSFTLEQVIEWCELSDLVEKSVQQLSGGEQQRVSFARSLLSGKKVILLDEPFSALDWQRRQQMLALVSKLNKQCDIQFFLVSHSLREIALCSDYVLQLKNGQLVQQGYSQDLINRLALEPGQQVFSRLNLTLESVDHEHQFSRWRFAQSKDPKHLVYSRGLETSVAIGETKVMTLDANKISLNKKLDTDSSILNHLEAQIIELTAKQHQTLVTLKVEGQTLFADISQLSSTRMALKKGDTVFAQFKAT